VTLADGIASASRCFTVQPYWATRGLAGSFSDPAFNPTALTEQALVAVSSCSGNGKPILQVGINAESRGTPSLNNLLVDKATSLTLRCARRRRNSVATALRVRLGLCSVYDECPGPSEALFPGKDLDPTSFVTEAKHLSSPVKFCMRTSSPFVIRICCAPKVPRSLLDHRRPFLSIRSDLRSVLPCRADGLIFRLPCLKPFVDM
jgi:hypothetical protein